jgi:hypothetical protein
MLRIRINDDLLNEAAHGDVQIVPISHGSEESFGSGTSSSVSDGRQGDYETRLELAVSIAKFLLAPGAK